MLSERQELVLQRVVEEYLAGGGAHPKTIVLAMSDSPRDAGELADGTGDLPGHDEDQTEGNQPDQCRRAQVESHATIEPVDPLPQQAIQFLLCGNRRMFTGAC